jgi:prolyl 4-hydroxylase
MNVFKKEWEQWLDFNICSGNCRLIMFKKSLDEGYAYDLIKSKLNIDYYISNTDSDKQVSDKQVSDNFTDRIALLNATSINTYTLEIYELQNFLTIEECKEIITIIDKTNLQASTTVNVGYNNSVNDYRTSKTCHFYDHVPFINEIDSRICKTIGINNRYSEAIQGQKYEVGQQFKIHTDYFDKAVLSSNKSIIGQRTWTFMVYLNDMEEGGGGYTSFPYAYVAKKPTAGTAIIWNNLDEHKKENIYSSHCGMPIINGEKYILTKWFKDQEIALNKKNEICEHHFFPIFHKIGFEKKHLQLDCIDKIKAWMKENERQFVPETNISGEITYNIKSNFLDINKTPPELRTDLVETMKVLLTKWIEYKSTLLHVSTYGIREYSRGSSLGNHYDRKNTHVISAIIHLEDKSDKPWVLDIEDHNFKPHQITMEYGDVIFYESTTCLHGRQTPFEGDYHRNMYIHFKPERWDEYVK